MASKKDVIRLTDADFKEQKYKTAPGGNYNLTADKKSKVEPSKHSDHNNLLLILNIPTGKHKGTKIRDYLSAKTPWKIVHLLKALGLSEKKAKARAKKGITLTELLKMALKADEIRAVVGEDKYEGKPQNKITQYLPPASEDDDDEDEEDDSEDEEDEDEDEEDEEEDEDEDSDEEDDEEDSDEDDEEDEDEEEDDEEDDDDDDEEEDEEDEDDEEEEDEDEDEEEVKPKRRAAKKTAARGKKKPAKKKGGRKTTRGKKK